MDSIICGRGAPVGFLHQATRTWRDNLPPKTRTHNYGGSYLAPTPTAWAEQQLGLGITKALARMCLTGMKMASDHSFKPNKIPKRRHKGTARPRPNQPTNPAPLTPHTPNRPPTPLTPPAQAANPTPIRTPPPPPLQARWMPLPTWSPIWTPTDQDPYHDTPPSTPPVLTLTPTYDETPHTTHSPPPSPDPPDIRPPPPPGFGPLTDPPGLSPAFPPDTLPWPNLFNHDPLDDSDLVNNSEAFLETFLDDEISETRERELLQEYLHSR